MSERFSARVLTIYHDAQPYDTVGSWSYHGGPHQGSRLMVTVSHMSDERYEFLVAMHELIEAYLCKRAGITAEAVTAFDEKWNAETDTGGSTEPGEDLRAPYREQHLFAATIEKILASALGVDWTRYGDEVNSLEWRK